MRKSEELTFSAESLREDLFRDAKAVGLPSGAAEDIAEKIAAGVTVWVEKWSIVTQDDLYRKIAKEAAKYNRDLAYVYQNRGKII